MSESHAKKWQQSWQQTTNPNVETQTEPKPIIKEKTQKRWITPGEKVIYSVFSFVTIVALLFMVSFSSNTDTLNREVQQLERNVNQQQDINQNLSYQVKEFSNPDRILRIAKENGLKVQNSKVKQASSLVNN
ncbi:cell division protein FtsL [Aquibacillus sediminis]|uniref:cell division protein FtsL n=1 Tax=Aquibacillus sediminis TaxID=2574734 RepID=UPI0011086273|nr:cell division protein FtsL [Aquibacillus sediminis]